MQGEGLAPTSDPAVPHPPPGAPPLALSVNTPPPSLLTFQACGPCSARGQLPEEHASHPARTGSAQLGRLPARNISWFGAL